MAVLKIIQDHSDELARHNISLKAAIINIFEISKSHMTVCKQYENVKGVAP